MSEIIKLIITYALYFLVCLAAALLVAYIEMRKLEKHISNKMSTFRESRAAHLQNLKEVHAQVDKLDKSVGEFDKSVDEIDESVGEIDESLDEIGKSLDRMNESMDRTIEFKRLISEYLDNKIKRIEARENFCESQFWDEKNIH